MRRDDREIKEFAQIIKVIEKCDVCRLALFDEEYPYILPLNFGMKVDGEQITLIFHGAAEGRKYELLARNNKASFEMDCSHRLVAQDGRCTMEYESIIGNGIIDIIDEKEKQEAMNLLMLHYHKEDLEYNKDILPHTTMFRLTVKSITGKRRMVK